MGYVTSINFPDYNCNISKAHKITDTEHTVMSEARKVIQWCRHVIHGGTGAEIDSVRQRVAESAPGLKSASFMGWFTSICS